MSSRQRQAEKLRHDVAALEQTSIEAAEVHAQRLKANMSTEQKIAGALGEMDVMMKQFGLLGLAFDRMSTASGEELLQLTFTQIDPREPTRPFSFAMHVSSDDVYRGTIKSTKRLAVSPSLLVPVPARHGRS